MDDLHHLVAVVLGHCQLIAVGAQAGVVFHARVPTGRTWAFVGGERRDPVHRRAPGDHLFNVGQSVVGGDDASGLGVAEHECQLFAACARVDRYQHHAQKRCRDH
ncbi:hypothetical protein D3C87_1772310 [compost metagenome]